MDEEFKMHITPKSELKDRISEFQNRLLEEDLDGALVLQNADLLYFAGSIQDGWLFIPTKGQAEFFVKKSLERAREESSLENVKKIDSFQELPEALEKYNIDALGLELDVLPASDYLYYVKLFQGVELEGISTEIKKQRMTKSDFELKMIRKAAKLMHEVHREVPDLISSGMSENEFAGKVEAVAREKGHEGFVRWRSFKQEMFYGHILTGGNGGVPSYLDSPTGGRGLSPGFPQSVSNKEIQPHEPISVDYVGVVNGYVVDQSRIYSIGELQDDKLAEAFEWSLIIQENLVNNAVPSLSADEVFNIAFEMVKDTEYEENFMGYGETKSPYIGHGVGLEIDELPIIGKELKTPLKENMVFALEPKFVFPKLGTVGIENTFVVQEDGLDRITITDDNLKVIGD